MLRAHGAATDRASHAVPGDAGDVRVRGGRGGHRRDRRRRGRDQARADRGRGRRARGRRLPARHAGKHRVHVRRAQALLRRHLLPLPGRDAAPPLRPVRARRQRHRGSGPGRGGHRHRAEVAPRPAAAVRDRAAGPRRPRGVLGAGRHGRRGARRVIVTVTLNPALRVGYEAERVTRGAANEVSRVSYRAGGRGLAVAKVLHTFGHEVVAAGLVGGSSGEVIRDDLARAGVATQFTRINGESRRILEITDAADGTVTTFGEPAPFITTEDLGSAAGHYRALMADPTAAGRRGSLPDGLPAETYGSLASYAAEAGVPVVLDASGSALRHAVSRRPALVIPGDATGDPATGDATGDPAAVTVPGAGTLAADGAAALVAGGAGAGAV